MKIRTLWLSGLLMLSIMIGACDRESEPESPYLPACVQETVRRYDLHINGEPTMTEMTLPEELTGANWGLKASLCLSGGYDISAYTGATLSYLNYPLKETCHGTPLALWVLLDTTTCVCVLKEDHSLPGLYALHETCSE